MSFFITIYRTRVRPRLSTLKVVALKNHFLSDTYSKLSGKMRERAKFSYMSSYRCDNWVVAKLKGSVITSKIVAFIKGTSILYVYLLYYFYDHLKSILEIYMIFEKKSVDIPVDLYG